MSILKQNKSTLGFWGEQLGNGILSIGKCKFTILQSGMVSYTYEDGNLLLECLAYWSRWLEVLLRICCRVYSVDQGLIPGSLQLRRKSGVGQEIMNCKFLIFQNFKILIQF